MKRLVIVFLVVVLVDQCHQHQLEEQFKSSNLSYNNMQWSGDNIPQKQQLQQQQQPQQQQQLQQGSTNVISQLVSIFKEAIEQKHLSRRKSRSTSGQRFCGKRLLDVLEWVCQGIRLVRGNEEINNSSTTTITTSVNITQTSEGKVKREETPSQSLNKSRSEALISTPRNRRGIVDECCKKSCKVDEMIQYCNVNNSFHK